MSRGDSQRVQQRLAREFVDAKLKKINWLSCLYQWLQTNFVNQIMFKNKPKVLGQLLKTHAEGEVYIPTELEAMMLEDARYLIRERYDNRIGINDLQALISKSKTSLKKSLLQMTDLESQIKLKQLPNSWKFTRPFSMLFKLLETLFQVIISNTASLIYGCCIMSMYQNAGLIGLVYPFSIFGYALLEETRPRKEFWRFLGVYTTGLLIFKFILNLSIMQGILDSDGFKKVNGYAKLGIYTFDNMDDIFHYMLPEILIMALIILNEI